ETRLGKTPQEGFRHAYLRQIHSDLVVVPDHAGGDCGEGDALASSLAGQLLMVRTADCVPVLLVDPGVRAVAAVHAGWRGVVQEILPRTLERMGRQFVSQPTNVLAAIGPCIRQNAF